MGPGLLLTAWVIFLLLPLWNLIMIHMRRDLSSFLDMGWFWALLSGDDIMLKLYSLWPMCPGMVGKCLQVKATVYGFISVSPAVDKHGQGWYLHMAFSTLFALSLSLPPTLRLCLSTPPSPLPPILLGVAWLHYKYYNKRLGEPLHSSQITTKPQLLPLCVLVSPMKVILTRTSLLSLLSRVLFEAARVLERKLINHREDWKKRRLDGSSQLLDVVWGV